MHREYDVIGDVMNLAARLMQAAGDGDPLRRRDLPGGAGPSTFQALPAILVKGKADPVPSTGRSSRPAGLTVRAAMVGRTGTRPLAERLGALQTARAGLVVIEGEAGIGKSRLIADLLDQARLEACGALAGAGDAIEQSTPYHAWRPIFAQLLGWAAPRTSRSAARGCWPTCRPTPALARLAPLLDASCRWTCPTTT